MSNPRNSGHRGQMLVLFSLSLVAIVLLVGLVVDVGYALSQRRTAQDAADFASIAGTKVVGQKLTGDAADGTDANVVAAIESTLAANGARVRDSLNLPLYTARYVNGAGTDIGPVGSGMPAGAQGVAVEASTTWQPYFLGIIGVSNWTAGANAAAISPAINLGTGILPFGVSAATLAAHDECPPGETAGSAACPTFHLSPGSLNVPGGFAWLKFGCYNRTVASKHYGLGQVLPAANGGCSNSKPFLDGEWGSLPTTPGNTYGCCTSVSQSTADGFGNYIASLPGNKASINDGQPTISYLEANDIAGWVPIWDYANGNGQNGYYHIVGYAAFEITHITGGKDIEGVIRAKDVSQNPQVYDAPDPSLTTLFNGTVQLVR